MVAREVLQASCDVTRFLYAMTKWAGMIWPQPRWICQNVLLAYYLAGVIPYVFYADSEEQILTLTLPATDLQKLREYCLEALTRRLQAMPEFWWLLQHHQPVRVSELSQLFVNVYPLGLDDVSNRLSFLVGIGAVQKSSCGRYHLTQLGETMAELWGRSPLGLEKPLTEMQEIGTWELADLWFD